MNRYRWLLTMLLAVAVMGTAVAAAELRTEALAGWRRYVAATERRRSAEAPGGQRFLALDFAARAAAHRRALFAGDVVLEEQPPSRDQGRVVAVPGALVHHWRGAVLVSGVTVDQLLDRLEAGPPPQSDVLRAEVLVRRPESMTVFLRVQRTKFVTVVYDTEHRVQFTRYDARHAASTSEAIRIQQVDRAGRPDERLLPAGDDDGYLWRLRAYWRYEGVPSGVIAECESLSLSRTVPFGLRTIAAPFIGSAARESMEAALTAVASLGRGRP